MELPSRNQWAIAPSRPQHLSWLYISLIFYGCTQPVSPAIGTEIVAGCDAIVRTPIDPVAIAAGCAMSPGMQCVVWPTRYLSGLPVKAIWQTPDCIGLKLWLNAKPVAASCYEPSAPNGWLLSMGLGDIFLPAG